MEENQYWYNCPQTQKNKTLCSRRKNKFKKKTQNKHKIKHNIPIHNTTKNKISYKNRQNINTDNENLTNENNYENITIDTESNSSNSNLSPNDDIHNESSTNSPSTIHSISNSNSSLATQYTPESNYEPLSNQEIEIDNESQFINPQESIQPIDSNLSLAPQNSTISTTNSSILLLYNKHRLHQAAEPILQNLFSIKYAIQFIYKRTVSIVQRKRLQYYLKINIQLTTNILYHELYTLLKSYYSHNPTILRGD